MDTAKRIYLSFSNLFIFFLFFTSTMALAGCGGSLPASIGEFAPCPSSPHCVSTKSSDSEHGIQPLTYSVAKEIVKQHLLNIVQKMPGAVVRKNQDNFMHFEFTSDLMGFVDDVEFYFESDGKIDFRSSSRIGYDDFGTNRNRMEVIRKHLSTVSVAK